MAKSTKSGRTFEEELLFGEATATLVGLVQSLGIRRKELASRLDVSPGRVSQILSGSENLTLRSLAALGWSMGVRFHLQPVAVADRRGTPAERDPAPPTWLHQLNGQAEISFRTFEDADRRKAPAFEAKRRFSVVDRGLRDVAA